MQMLVIRNATQADSSILLTLIHELAAYEKASDRVKVTPERLGACLFNAQPFAYALLAFYDQMPVGYAIYFHNYSSYLGQPGIYLEDLYVKPDLRGKNIGKHLLARLAKLAQQKECAFMSWSVLNWNTPAMDFYAKVGARPADCVPYKLSGEELDQLAAFSN